MGDYYSICPQCGIGQGVFYWMDVCLMRCDHCGLFVDITGLDDKTDYDEACPSCVLEALKRKGLWKAEHWIPGKGVICIDGDARFIDDEYKSYKKAVKDYDRDVLKKKIDPDQSYITKADGAKVEFLRGNIETVISMH